MVTCGGRIARRAAPDVGVVVPESHPGRRDMIYPAKAPGVAAQYPPHRETSPPHRSVDLNGGDGVGAARRVVLAPRRHPGGDDQLVTPDESEQGPRCQRGWRPGCRLHRHLSGSSHLLANFRDAAASAASRSRPRSALLAPDAAGSARTTREVPAGKSAKRSDVRARRRRLTEFRSTAGPTAFGTTKPTVVDFVGEPGARWTTTRRDEPRRPLWTVAVKSACRLIRCRAGSTAGSGGELGTALAPARRDDGATRTRPHAQTEAVRLRPAPVVRLKGPLAHDSSPQLVKDAAPRNPGGALSPGPRVGHAPARRHGAPSVETDVSPYASGSRAVKPRSGRTPARLDRAEPCRTVGAHRATTSKGWRA